MNFWILPISVVAGLATIAGVYTVIKFHKWSMRNTTPIIAVAAGIIFATAFFELIPESIELARSSWPYWTIVGFALFFMLEQFMVMHACSDKDDPCSHTPSRTAVLGIGLHSLVDGMLIGLGFEVSSAVGIIATVAVVVHEFPEGIFSYTLLVHGKVEEKQALFYSWLIALATPVGTLLTLLLIRGWSDQIIGALLAITAGNFIYISATDLIPETHKKSARSSVVLVIVGIVIVYILRQLFD